MMKRAALFTLSLLTIASPAGLQWWLTKNDRLRFEAVAHASAENASWLQSAPTRRPQRARPMKLEAIPDRFVELLLEAPAGAPTDALTRTWFPKTFLWAPRVVTDEQGHATVDFTVPDTLTDWRVVGQSLGADGRASGDLHRFSTEKAAHVSLFLPERLRTGDRVDLPLEAVNRTGAPLAARLTVQADGAALLSDALAIAPAQAVVSAVPFTAAAPQTVTLQAALGDHDAVRLPLTVDPAGWARHTSQGGVVVPRRTASFDDGRAGTLRLRVFPIRETLDVAREAASPPRDRDEALYAWALGCLLEDAPLRRTAELVIRQETPRDAEPSEALSEMLAERLCDTPSPSPAQPWWTTQREDGSWQVPAGAPLSQLVSTTALHTVRLDDPVTALRSSAFVERHGGRVTDPFSAAALLWTGLADAHLASLLHAAVRAAIVIEEDGSVSVRPSGTRPDGRPATAVDVLAMASLVMPPAEAATYRAALAGRLSPAAGWGDGFSGLLALTALAAAPEAHPETTLSLSGPGGPLGEARVGADLVVAVPEGSHAYTLLADGPAADVAWQLTLEQWHTEDTQAPALDATVSTPARLERGARGTVSVRVTAATDAPIVVSHALPAGVQLVPGTAKATGADVSIRSRAGGLTVSVPAQRPETLTVTYDVQATLAGTVHGGGVNVRSGEQEIWRAAGRRWEIGGR